jgi:uncharacterized membrane protein
MAIERTFILSGPEFGRVLFGISVAGLAILSLAYGNFVPLADPYPSFLPWPKAWAYGPGAILLAAGVGLCFVRTSLVSMIIIGLYEIAWAATRVRPVLLQPLSIGAWYGFSEAMGTLSAAWILYAALRRQNGSPAVPVMIGDRALHLARMLFGAACMVYGAGHFAYAKYTATMVPGWFPDRIGLAYLTGACHLAAGLGLLVGILPRLAATLEAIMIFLFGALVWLPSFFARPKPEWAAPAQFQWSETLLTLLLSAAAWIVAASLRHSPWGFASVKRQRPKV